MFVICKSQIVPLREKKKSNYSTFSSHYHPSFQDKILSLFLDKIQFYSLIFKNCFVSHISFSFPPVEENYVAFIVPCTIPLHPFHSTSVHTYFSNQIHIVLFYMLLTVYIIIIDLLNSRAKKYTMSAFFLV